MPHRLADLRDLVARALANEVERTSFDTPPARAFEALCGSLRGRLQPLFGAAAVQALFARALHLARVEFPWLSLVEPVKPDACSLAGLEDAAAQRDPAEVRDGVVAVLAHDLQLLITFIGEDLAVPLIEQAWGISVERSKIGPKTLIND